MTKATVIIGEDESGKSLTAKLLSKNFEKEEVVWIDGRNLKYTSFPFGSCTQETKCVIIDDANPLQSIDSLVMLIHGIKVDKQYSWSFEINPKIIITFPQELTKTQIEGFPSSITRRIEVIECKKENLEKLIQSLK